MGKVRAGITMSLDGYVAGPNATLEVPLGEGGEELHEWGIATRDWRERHGYEGGEEGADSEVIAESTENIGAQIMGRNMYSGGFGPGAWSDDPNPTGWWGDEPPFQVPVFVLTHHAREPLEMKGGTTFHFVTDGIEAALEQARAAAEDKDVFLAGGGRAHPAVPRGRARRRARGAHRHQGARRRRPPLRRTWARTRRSSRSYARSPAPASPT